MIAVVALVWTQSSFSGVSTQATSPVVIGASKDATLYAESGTTSNGASQSLFVGVTAGTGDTSIRRTVIAFDMVSAVPAGATITDVQLRRNRDKGQGAHTITIHRLTADWGEGTADTIGSESRGTANAAQGDSTWTSRFLGTSNWTTSGGDFVGSVSASTSVGPGSGAFIWDSEGVVVDVQSWLDNPSTNFGWILKHVNETTGRTVQRFGSRQNGVTSNQPQLIIFSLSQSRLLHP